MPAEKREVVDTDQVDTGESSATDLRQHSTTNSKPGQAMKRIIVVATLALAACGGGGAPDASSSACLAAFEAAAGADSMADSVSDLYPAVRSCGTLAEWTAAFDAVEGAGFDGPADSVLSNVCLADELTGEPLCSE